MVLHPPPPWSQLSNKKILVENWLLRTGIGMRVRVRLWESGGGNGRGDWGGKLAQSDSRKAD